jgi:hypothetical protein
MAHDDGPCHGFRVQCYVGNFQANNLNFGLLKLPVPFT